MSHIGIRYSLKIPCSAVFTITLSKFPIRWGYSRCYETDWPLLTSPSFNRTTSPSWILSLFSFHFLLVCKVDKYSCFHCSQNESANIWTWCHWLLCRWPNSKFPGGAGATLAFWVQSIAGESTVEIGFKAREFIVAMTTAINVVKTSCLSLVGVFNQESLQNMSGYPNQSFPHSYMGGIGSVKCPSAALILQETFHLWVTTVNLELFNCSNKIRPSVWMKMLHWSCDSQEASQSTNEDWCW